MTKLISFVVLAWLARQCGPQQAGPAPEPRSVCSVKDPAKELSWLHDIITKADADKATMAYQGNYLGNIYLESFRSQPIFVVEMMMGSGALAGYFFRCNGERVYPTAEEITSVVANFQKKNVVYANIP